ncbi:hypothetical protein IF1G_10509 [Cordyceps javanica]|uniref:Uncharacterized protein n=1 Tax=Cordyceps javanica TaxID=43265 RepID=A0A545UMR9_9HYPO|nr:hypothetical protein IF1G_10509 [Cordyceps javanica]
MGYGTGQTDRQTDRHCPTCISWLISLTQHHKLHSAAVHRTRHDKTGAGGREKQPPPPPPPKYIIIILIIWAQKSGFFLSLEWRSSDKETIWAADATRAREPRPPPAATHHGACPSSAVPTVH